MDNMEYLNEFLEVKRLEGCSEGTIEQYGFHISRFLRTIDKPDHVIEGLTDHECAYEV